jgi:hypothetical protein
MIAYGCGAWYINVHNAKGKWHIIQKLVERLDRLQYSCLMQISGAFYNAAKRVLDKELFIERIVITLGRLSLAQHIRTFYDEDIVLAQRTRTERRRVLLAEEPPLYDP